MKFYLTILLLIITTSASFCQRGEKLESLKVGFLTNKLNLDSRTAEQFWPLYHQYENELMVVVQEKRRMNQNETRNADEILDQEQKALDIKRKYSTLFSKVISADQINQLYRGEKEFRQMIINRSQKREMRLGNDQERPARFNRNEQRMEANPRRMEAAPPQNFNNNRHPNANPQPATPRNATPAPSNGNRREGMRR